jgi:hypothetical protein
MTDLPSTLVVPSAPTEVARPRINLVATQRVLQIVLGCFWILDAALQYQPFMFGKQFVPSFITGNAGGQPEPISWLITTAGHFISPDVVVWNTLFATVQVFIGFGLLFRRSVRPALLVSFAWAFGVWFFGEGLGDVLTGSATALTGAPGSVFIYGLLGLMAWPRSASIERTGHDKDGDVTGIASSAAAQGVGGALTPLAVWAGYWVLSAVLFLFPMNRTQTSISSTITGMASGTPEWYAHFLNSFGNAFSSIGVETAWVLAIASLIIGLGPLVVRRPGLLLFIGGLLSFVLWITGQGFLGGVLSGSGTDPNTSPLIILLALALVPVVVPMASEWQSPLAGLLTWRPMLTVGTGVALICALWLAATYPEPAQASSNNSMSGMTGMSDSSGSSSSSSMSGMAMSGSGSETAGTASCTKGNNHAPRTGLDITNTPNMIMSGNLGMNMNGADASAAAGLNATKSNWTYSGPALPQALAQELLSKGKNTVNDVHMASSGCAAEPTFSQEINAEQYIQATTLAVAHLSSPLAAVAAGYVLASPSNYPVTYYINSAIEAANVAAKMTLSPQSVDGLVYAQTPSGQEVLAAAMYVLPSSVTTPPMPYGALVQWHQRTNVCGPDTAPVANAFQITGVVPCATGAVQRATPYVTMVWQVPVAGGPLAIQPPDIQIVESAIMASTT